MFQVGFGRAVQGAFDDSAVLSQKLAPVGQKLRVVMLARAMGLQAGPDVDVHAVGVLALR